MRGILLGISGKGLLIPKKETKEEMVLFPMDMIYLEETARTVAALLLPAQRQNRHMEGNVLTDERMVHKWTWNPGRQHGEPQDMSTFPNNLYAP